MRNLKFAPNECYHICGRGTQGTNIFLDQRDFIRFLFLILHFQSPTPTNNIHWYISNFDKKGKFGLNEDRLKDLARDRQVALMSFAIMDNHFHLLVQNLDDQAISVYMHRVLMGYSKYFNAKYKRTGHVFQGPFKAVHIESNSQLLLTSAYIHKNPIDMPGYKNSYAKYKFSSLQDYVKENRWGHLLKTQLILDQYKSADSYKNFVDTSKTKEHEELQEI